MMNLLRVYCQRVQSVSLFIRTLLLAPMDMHQNTIGLQVNVSQICRWLIIHWLILLDFYTES